LSTLWRSVKHEDLYLKGDSAMGELLIGLTQYSVFYNGERTHQSLENKTPNEAYADTSGGCALIVDKFPRKEEELSVPLRSTGSSSEQTKDQKAKATPGQPSCE
jgi:hypothetical protein